MKHYQQLTVSKIYQKIRKIYFRQFERPTYLVEILQEFNILMNLNIQHNVFNFNVLFDSAYQHFWHKLLAFNIRY